MYLQEQIATDISSWQQPRHWIFTQRGLDFVEVGDEAGKDKRNA